MNDERFFMPEWEPAQRQIGFSQAVRHGDLLSVSGTASLDSRFAAKHAGDFPAQLRHVYDAIGRTLSHFGLGFADVVQEVMYTTDMDALLEGVPIRRAYYGNGPFPASTGVEVRRLILPELMIEVQVTARFPDRCTGKA